MCNQQQGKKHTREQQVMSVADNGSSSSGGRRFLWKRSASGVIPGSIKPVVGSSTTASPSRKGGHSKKFSEFQRESADAWDIEDDDTFKFAVLNYQRPGGSAGKKKSSSSKVSSQGVLHGEGPGSSDKEVADAEQVEKGMLENASNLADVKLTSSESAAEKSRGAKGTTSLIIDERLKKLEPKFAKILEEPNVDLEKLRKICWSGICPKYRPDCWRFLSGYLPANKERRVAVLRRKREEYWAYVDQYFERREQESNKGIFHQIHIDVPRTNPSVEMFQQPLVQRMFERILYVWAIRHPASGYVQGINDLVTPFFLVFLSEFVDDALTADCEKVSKESLDIVEADSFWCMSKLLDSIQDNYTFAQPGIQRKILALKELVSRIDSPLNLHLQNHDVEYLQFSFRWMNCLLMREVPISCIIRVWDTYLSEGDGFASLHLYVCAAFLVRWSKDIQQLKDFQSIMLFIQNLDTANWGNKDIELLLSEAYMWKYKFNDAPNHFG